MAREFRASVAIAATPERVWQVLAEFESWPEWTASVRGIERLGTAPLAVGSRVRIHQPKLRPAVWTITAWEPTRRFVWVSSSPGLAMTGEHSIAAEAGNCVVNLNLRFAGLLGFVAGQLMGGLTRRYVALEAAGLKARCEKVSGS